LSLRTCVRLGVLAVAVMATACGGGDALEDAGLGEDARVDPPDDAGLDGGPDDAGGEVDASVGEDAGPAPVRDVEWTIEPEPMTIDGDIALDFFYPYVLVNEERPLDYLLTLDRCMQLADREESCETMTRDNLPGESGVRWGIDPGSYAVGENRYRFHLKLIDAAGVTVDEDEIVMVLTVTSCSSCVGS